MTIINRDCRFIFLKTRKTASSSLEIHLITNSVLGGDIYATAPESARYGVSRRRRCTVMRAFGRYVYFDSSRSVRKRLAMIREHQSARDLKALVSNPFWANALKVCAVRNPWEVLFSYWRWRTGQKSIDVAFEPWARAALSGDPYQIELTGSRDARELLHDFLFLDGQWIPDYTIRFEDLDGGIRTLSDKLGLDIPPLQIHEKPSRRIDYRDHYSRPLARQLEEYYADMLEMTGYSF